MLKYDCDHNSRGMNKRSSGNEDVYYRPWAIFFVQSCFNQYTHDQNPLNCDKNW